MSTSVNELFVLIRPFVVFVSVHTNNFSYEHNTAGRPFGKTRPPSNPDNAIGPQQTDHFGGTLIAGAPAKKLPLLAVVADFNTVVLDLRLVHTLPCFQVTVPLNLALHRPWHAAFILKTPSHSPDCRQYKQLRRRSATSRKVAQSEQYPRAVPVSDMQLRPEFTQARHPSTGSHGYNRSSCSLINVQISHHYPADVVENMFQWFVERFVGAALRKASSKANNDVALSACLSYLFLDLPGVVLHDTKVVHCHSHLAKSCHELCSTRISNAPPANAPFSWLNELITDAQDTYHGLLVDSDQKDTSTSKQTDAGGCHHMTSGKEHILVADVTTNHIHVVVGRRNLLHSNHFWRVTHISCQAPDLIATNLRSTVVPTTMHRNNAVGSDGYACPNADKYSGILFNCDEIMAGISPPKNWRR